jgi:eukaryotic-like serine/threonine-protein kinase
MAHVSAEQIGQRAVDLGLLTQQQLFEVQSSFGGANIGVQDLMQNLVRREYLTNYQVERLLKAEKGGFFYDRYKILYLVGTGTFSRVYRAVHCDTGEVRALKVLRSRFSDRPDQYGQFVREGKFGCSLRHANIVRIDEVVSHGRMHFFVMEFIEGRNLRDFVKIRKKLHPMEATRLMLDITEGLRYAFDHGLTHRDLKLSNVLVSSRGQAKLVDFGLASIDETLTEDELERLPNPRTIDYAALERATGVRKDDTRSDIYFLGCMYYNMLTGIPPLPETRDRIQRLSKQRFLDVVSVRKVDSTVPQYIAAIVSKAMHLDPSRRYQNPVGMLNDLEVASRRLSELAQGSSEGSSPDDTQIEGGDSSLSLATSPLMGRTVLVVESDGQRQDNFRKSFKKAGARVLLISDPSRALGRLHQDPKAAECLIIDAEFIGQPAVEMFNALVENKDTASIPAILLFDETQKKLAPHAKTSEHRRVVFMPITTKQFREMLLELIGTRTAEDAR